MGYGIRLHVGKRGFSITNTILINCGYDISENDAVINVGMVNHQAGEVQLQGNSVMFYRHMPWWRRLLLRLAIGRYIKHSRPTETKWQADVDQVLKSIETGGESSG